MCYCTLQTQCLLPWREFQGGVHRSDHEVQALKQNVRDTQAAILEDMVQGASTDPVNLRRLALHLG